MGQARGLQLGPDAVYDKVGNILLSRIMGAEVRLVDAGFDIASRPSRQDGLDSVAATALIDLVRSGRIEPGSCVLYAHLGGQPALNACAGRF